MTQQCDFCFKTQHQVNQLVLGDKVGICDQCIAICQGIINKKAAGAGIDNVDPMELRDYLDMYVTSQDEAKQILSVAVSNHIKRINDLDSIIEKSNIILLGPTGSGKTLLAKTIADYLGLPFVIADATTLTESGYYGEDVDSILIKLIAKADGDISVAETGIVFIDEIDKIAKSKNAFAVGKEPGSEGVQQALLKLVEGTVFSVETDRAGTLADIDTSNILFIAAGSFTGLDAIKKTGDHKSQIGFTADVNNTQIKTTESIDLERFGMIPEFVGRFPIIAEVQELNSDDMLAVLSTVENNLVTQYKHLFKYDHVRLTFDSAALKQIAAIAIDKKTGARSLRAIMEKTLMPHMFKISQYTANNINKVRITKSLINSPREITKKNNAKRKSI